MGLAKRMLEEDLDREPVLDADDDSWWDRVKAVNPHRCADPDCGGTIDVGDVFMRNRDSEEIWHTDCFQRHQDFLRAVNDPRS